MAKLLPISRQVFTGKYWKRVSNYSFTANDTVCQLVTQEMPKAMVHLPLAFIPQDGGFVPVALQGLAAQRNLLVAPDGSWLMPYVPAAYRSYPFRVVDGGDGKQILCFDEDSQLLADEGEAFYQEDGEPTPFIQQIAEFLQALEQNRLLTERQCAVLQQLELIVPWNVKVQGENGEQLLQGLYRVDEEKLYALSDSDYLRLREVGAMGLVYCQMLSMQHLPRLAELSRHHDAVQKQLAERDSAKELDLSFMASGDTLSFGTF